MPLSQISRPASLRPTQPNSLPRAALHSWAPTARQREAERAVPLATSSLDQIDQTMMELSEDQALDYLAKEQPETRAEIAMLSTAL